MQQNSPITTCYWSTDELLCKQHVHGVAAGGILLATINYLHIIG